MGVLPKLEALNLDTNRFVSSGSIQAFFGSQRFRQLRHLSMSNCELERGDLWALGRLTEPAELRSLNLGSTKLSGMAARHLAKSSCLHGLVEFSAGLGRMQDEGLQVVLGCGNLRALRNLDVRLNDLGPAAASSIADWEGATRLTSLNLGNNEIGDEGIKAIAQSPRLSNLNELELRYNEIRDRGVRALVESTTLSRLTKLRLSFRYHDQQLFSDDLQRELFARFGQQVCHFD